MNFQNKVQKFLIFKREETNSFNMSVDISLAAEIAEIPLEFASDDDENFSNDGRFFSPGDIITK